MNDGIYNDAIVAAARDRSHAGRLADPGRSVTRDNPLCGDRVTFDLAVAGGRIARIAHKTRGCLLTEAAASLLAAHAAGETAGSLAAQLATIRRWLDDGGEPPWPELAIFAPVRAVRSRHECVLLPFEALAEAMEGSAGDGIRAADETGTRPAEPADPLGG